MPDKSKGRRNFLKKSMIALSGLGTIASSGFAEEAPVSISEGYLSNKEGGEDVMKIAFITNTYRNSAHADVIGTKLFLGIPTDEGLVRPRVKIVSVWIDQIGANDTGVRISEMNGAKVFPTIEEALCLGGDKLAVDGVVYVGEHGDYPYNRLGEKMYPRMNYLEKIFRVFDASGRSVPLFTDKALSYSWLDSKWIYDRGKELKVPMMAGSSLPYCWRDPYLEHDLDTHITEAVAIGYASLDAYGFHVVEILQCMLERRKNGETGVASVEGLQGQDVWNAIDSGKISAKLVNAACDKIKGRAKGPMRELVKKPSAVIIRYNDGTRGAILMLDEYVKEGWAYAAVADGKTVATEFVLDNSMTYYHFSYLTLNIEQFLLTGVPPIPIERSLLTSSVIDLGIRSLKEGRVKETPFLNIHYNAKGSKSIRPSKPRPTGIGNRGWPPAGYEFIIPDRFKKKN